MSRNKAVRSAAVEKGDAVSCGRPVFVFRDAEHTRFTKRCSDSELIARFDKTENWIAVRVEEISPHGNTTQSRVISFALHDDERAALIAFLSKGEGQQ